MRQQEPFVVFFSSLSIDVREQRLILHFDDQWRFVRRMSNTERITWSLLLMQPNIFRRVIARARFLRRITRHFIASNDRVMRWLLLVDT